MSLTDRHREQLAAQGIPATDGLRDRLIEVATTAMSDHIAAQPNSLIYTRPVAAVTRTAVRAATLKDAVTAVDALPWPIHNGRDCRDQRCLSCVQLVSWVSVTRTIEALDATP